MTTAYPIVRFVDAPNVDANVRFDFNSAGAWSDRKTWPNHDGWSLGVPQRDGEPDAFGADWAFREVTFNLIVEGTKRAASRIVSALSRELLRRENWLLFQLSEFSPPVWLRTYRISQAGALDFTRITSATDSSTDRWGIPIQLEADPFLYGERVTLAPVTVKNTPADPTNPMWFTLPEILGDAPTPLRIEANPTSSSDSYFFFVRGVHLILTHGAAPVRVRTADMTAVSPANKQTGLFPGEAIDNDWVRSLSLPTTLTKLATAAPNIPFGTYTILARIEAVGDYSSGLDKARFWAGHDIDALTYRRTFDFRPSTDTGIDSTAFGWVNLGQVTHPFGGTELDGSGPLKLAFWGRKISGAMFEYHLDEIILVPHDTDDPSNTALAIHGRYQDDLSTFDHSWVYDADTNTTYLLVDGQPVSVYPATTVTGGLPIAVPGVPNTLLINFGAAPEGTADYRADDLQLTTDVTVSYQPQWLYLASLPEDE